MNKIGIVGFGISGIAACRWAIDLGFEPTVFEKNSTFGGCWLTNSYEDCKLQTSKYNYSFSDIPMPSNYPLYPSGDQIFKYLKDYITYHNLEKYTNYNSNVQSIKLIDNIWELVSNNILYKFNFLIISSGFYSTKKQLPHSIIPREVKANMFNGKDVVLIGNGPSGCDLSCLAVKNNAKSVTLIYRSPKWIIPRYICGISLHFLTNQFLLKKAMKHHTYLIKFLLCVFIKIYYITKKINIFFNIKIPNEKITRLNLAMNDEIYKFISQNKIAYNNETLVNVNNDNTIETVDLSFNKLIYKYDILIDCTGYKQSIPLLGYNDSIPSLYKNIIIPGYNNIGIIGFASVFNWLETSDLQVRWLLNVFKKNIILPSKEEQLVNINYQTSVLKKEYRVDYNDRAYTIHNYMKSLTKDIKNISR